MKATVAVFARADRDVEVRKARRMDESKVAARHFPTMCASEGANTGFTSNVQSSLDRPPPQIPEPTSTSFRRI